MGMPKRFIEWAYRQRGELVRRQAFGEEVSHREVFLGFTRHTPTVISNGPAGLNGSVKGVGFLPKSEFLDEYIERYMAHIKSEYDDSYPRRGLDILSELLWSEEGAERIDFNLLGTLELAKKHTWANLRTNPAATLLFYEPPMVSFELRCDVEIHEKGPIHTFLNAQHDVYHGPNPKIWADRPAYLFRIREIFDNSVGKNAFGKRIYP